MLKYKNLIVWLILLCAIISECMAASTNPTWIGSPFFRTGNSNKNQVNLRMWLQLEVWVLSVKM